MKLSWPVAFTALILSLITTAPAISAEISVEAQEIEKAFETRIQQKIQTLFGEDLKLAVNVRLLPNALTQGATADADVGYAPFATESLQEYIDGATKDGVSFSSIEVDIQAPEEVDEKVLESVKGVVETR